MSLFSKLRGTIETLFQLGLNGPQWKNNGGNIEARNSTDSALVIVRGLTPAGNTDLVTKLYADTLGISVGGNSGQTAIIKTHTVLTATKTGNYTANENEVVPFDSTAGTFTLTFPASPHNGASVSFVDVGGVAGGGVGNGAVTFARNGKDFIWVDQTKSTGNQTSNANYGLWEWFYNGTFWSLV
jgi:hypothetical protein